MTIHVPGHAPSEVTTVIHVTWRRSPGPQEIDLKTFYEVFGKVEKVSGGRVKETGGGSALVQFESQDTADMAMAAPRRWRGLFLAMRPSGK
ncbi:hypothetical protein HDV00_009256, partial [Rhizophlyctis rosea]